MRIKSRRHRWSEAGASAVEYAILVSMIAAVIIGIITVFGIKVGQLFNITW